MTITIRIVAEYPEEIYQDLIKRNLEQSGVFIPAWEHYFEVPKEEN